MTEWQPIETAPKPRKRFLINDLDAKTANVKISFGFKPELDSWAERHGYTIFDDRGNAIRATHWMPLPEPPK